MDAREFSAITEVLKELITPKNDINDVERITEYLSICDCAILNIDRKLNYKLGPYDSS